MASTMGLTVSVERYGLRRVPKMYKEWSDLREAVRLGDLAGIQESFDKVENWVDFAFGKNADQTNQLTNT